VIDLSQAIDPVLSYWSWYAAAGVDTVASLTVDASSDSGATWVNLRTEIQPAPVWAPSAFYLASYLDLTSGFRLRFVACDLGEDTYVEAAVDDVSIEEKTARRTPPAPSENAAAFAIGPNPFGIATTVRYLLPAPEPLEITVYDPAGRRVRKLLSGPQPAGEGSVTWDGRNDDGEAVSSGVYFYRVVSPDLQREGRLLVVR
jgi:hypothetical protein